MGRGDSVAEEDDGELTQVYVTVQHMSCIRHSALDAESRSFGSMDSETSSE